MTGVIKYPLFTLIDDIRQVIIDIESLAANAHLQHTDGLVCGAGLAVITFSPLNPHKVNRAINMADSNIHFAVGARKDKS